MSGCFCDLLRWSVGRHWLLRSQWTYFPPVCGSWLSELTLIALYSRANDCGNGVPIQVLGLQRRSWELANPMPLVMRHPQRPRKKNFNPLPPLRGPNCRENSKHDSISLTAVVG